MKGLLQISLCTAVIDGLKVSHTGVYRGNQIQKLVDGVPAAVALAAKVIDYCAYSPNNNVIKPWRARALCKENQVVNLDKYLEAAGHFKKSDQQSEDMNFEEQKKPKKGSKKERNQKKRAGKNAPSPPPPTEGTQVFLGKFCGQGVKSGGEPILTNVYGYTKNKTTPVDTVFKTGSLCYNAVCTGRCEKDFRARNGRADKSVKFKCDATTPTKTVATWFAKAECEIASDDTAGTATGGTFVNKDFSGTDAAEFLNVVIDGVSTKYTVKAACTTNTACATALNAQIVGASVALDGGFLKITSDTKGVLSKVAITTVGSGSSALALFGTVTAVDGTSTDIIDTAGTLTGGSFGDNDFSGGGTNADDLIITVDGVEATYSVVADCTLVATCAAELTIQIKGASVAAVGGLLKITSDKEGVGSTVAIGGGSGQKAKDLFGTTTSVDGVSADNNDYTYTAEEVTELNSGTQGRYCWGTKDKRAESNPQWETITKKTDTTDDKYYYSYISTQKLPVCTR